MLQRCLVLFLLAIPPCGCGPDSTSTPATGPAPPAAAKLGDTQLKPEGAAKTTDVVNEVPTAIAPDETSQPSTEIPQHREPGAATPLGESPAAAPSSGRLDEPREPLHGVTDTAQDKGSSRSGMAVRISGVKTEKVMGSYSTTLSISPAVADAAMPAKVHALAFYLRDAKPGEATDLAARGAVGGDLAVGMASGDGKGFDGMTFFSYGANIKGEAGVQRMGACMWIRLPSKPEYDLTKQSTIRIPLGEWLLNGVSLEGSGRCAIALGTLEFEGPKKMPTFRAASNTVEFEAAF